MKTLCVLLHYRDQDTRGTGLCWEFTSKLAQLCSRNGGVLKHWDEVKVWHQVGDESNSEEVVEIPKAPMEQVVCSEVKLSDLEGVAGLVVVNFPRHMVVQLNEMFHAVSAMELFVSVQGYGLAFSVFCDYKTKATDLGKPQREQIILEPNSARSIKRITSTGLVELYDDEKQLLFKDGDQVVFSDVRGGDGSINGKVFRIEKCSSQAFSFQVAQPFDKKALSKIQANTGVVERVQDHILDQEDNAAKETPACMKYSDFVVYADTASLSIWPPPSKTQTQNETVAQLHCILQGLESFEQGIGHLPAFLDDQHLNETMQLIDQFIKDNKALNKIKPGSTLTVEKVDEALCKPIIRYAGLNHPILSKTMAVNIIKLITADCASISKTFPPTKQQLLVHFSDILDDEELQTTLTFDKLIQDDTIADLIDTKLSHINPLFSA